MIFDAYSLKWYHDRLITSVQPLIISHLLSKAIHISPICFVEWLHWFYCLFYDHFFINLLTKSPKSIVSIRFLVHAPDDSSLPGYCGSRWLNFDNLARTGTIDVICSQRLWYLISVLYKTLLIWLSLFLRNEFSLWWCRRLMLL